jgi:anthranilate phosphoribosyltransferase
LGVKTFFNLLGPLVNPAAPQYQLSGVYNAEVGRIYSYFLQSQCKQFAVVFSLDGYDEVSLTSPIKHFSQQGETLINFKDFGFSPLSANDITGGATIEESAKIFMDILSGKGSKAQNDVVIANSAIAISCYSSNKSLSESVEIAREVLVSGKALSTFNKLISIQ